MPRRAVAVLLGAVSVLAIGVGTASSEPGFTPDADDIVGVGSDTLQGIINHLAELYPAFGDRRLASFDAFSPSSPIVIRDPDQIPGSGDEVVISRPNGSGAGISALCTSLLLDFARSVLPSNGSACADTLAFSPFASGGLSYIVDDFSSVPTNLTATDLRDIYTCGRPGFEPKLPRGGSTTRTFFLQQIGVTEADIALAVAAGCLDDTVQENQPHSVDGNPVALMPMSVAAYRANPDGVVLASDVDPAAFLAYRDLFIVVRDFALNDPGVQYYFGPDGVLCQLMEDGELGFESVGDRCGVPLPDV